MFKLCLIRGCRTAALLIGLTFVAMLLVFYLSPNVGIFRHYVELKVKKELQIEQFEISQLKVFWEEGPAIGLGSIVLETPELSVHEAQTTFSYSFMQLIKGDFAPRISLTGGAIDLNLDVEQDSQQQLPYILVILDDVQLHWLFQGERQTFHHVAAKFLADFSELSFKADGVDAQLALNGRQQIELLHLRINDFSALPASWLEKLSNPGQFDLDIQSLDAQTWLWKTAFLADDGLLSIPKAHLELPISRLNAEGELIALEGETFALQQLTASSLHWKSGDNFADFRLNWQDNRLHIEALDGKTTMPMLWSWLWMLGGDGWHRWLTSMQYGQVEGVQATLDLNWPDPLHAVPSSVDLKQMKYRVSTRVHDADIALGLHGDFLYHIDGKVEVDEHHLTARIDTAELNRGVGIINGSYAIAWDSLLMDIQAKGEIDVGKLHQWLEPDSARALHWRKAPATATVQMQWDVKKSAPDRAHAIVRPTRDFWYLKPLGSPMMVKQGKAVWDIQKGLDLQQLKVDTPWFHGDLDLFLNEQWSLQRVNLDGVGKLVNLTEQFALPIVKPEGETKLKVQFNQQQWTGSLDFEHSDWESFAGYDKQGNEPLSVQFSGKAEQDGVLPIFIEHMDSAHDGFKFESNILIDKQKLDFHFKNIETDAVRADLRLLLPLDKKLPWGLDVQADYVERPVLRKYLKNVDKGSKLLQRPWNIVADSQWLAWGESYAEDVHLQLASAERKTGEFSTGYVATKDVDLEETKGSFTLFDEGKVELHHFEARSSGQHVIITGSVQPVDTGVYGWQGFVVMDGEFGRLMKQAELDKLFKEGKMNALFLGKGEFKEGESWWRGLNGSFRLRVDEGRIMEGGTLTHLLAAISLFDLPKYLIFQRGDVIGEGLLYDKLQIEATFDAEKLNVNQLALRSSALDAGGKGEVNLSSGEIDMLLIARPWQNIEAIVGNIPLVGYILAGEDKSFLRKVYRVHGPASDATVDELSPEDAGLPHSGLLESLFSLPGQLFGD